MRLHPVLAFFITISLPISGYSQRGLEGRLPGLISPARLTQTVKDLVALGNRQGGTPSGEKSSAYVEKKFRQMGLSATVESDPIVRTWIHGKWSLAIESPRTMKGMIQDASLAGFSPSIPSQSLRLVRGDIESKYPATKDSCAVLVDEIPDGQTYRRYVDVGARAIIAFENGKARQYALGAKVVSLSGRRVNEIPLYVIPGDAGSRLMDELRSTASIRVRISAMAVVDSGSPRTVTAYIPGTTGKYVIVCAHGDSDSGGPGADDNASGVAGVLEIAQAIKTLQRSGALKAPAIGVRFIVWGKEYHSAGEYVRRHADSLSQIAAVINFDEIGYGRSRNCIYFEGNDVATNHSVLRLMDAIGEEYAGKMGFWKEATTNPSQGGTDSYVFSPAYLKHLGVQPVDIPSITIFCAAWDAPRTLKQTEGWTSRAWKGDPDSVVIDYSPYYHSTLDIPKMTTEKEPFNMMWAAKAVGIALIRFIP